MASDGILTVESLSGAAPPLAGGTAARDSLVERLHQARTAGDMATCSALDRLRSAPEQGGETGNVFIQHKSTSIGLPGDPSLNQGGGLQPESLFANMSVKFGQSIHVRGTNPTTKEFNQSMAIDSDGNLYIAWQDDYTTHDYIQLYRSADFGMSWSAYGFITNSSAHLQSPCLAVGEGQSDLLLIAYIVDDGVNPSYPEVAATKLGQWNCSFSNPPIVAAWEGYADPVIWTDSVDFSAWYVYLSAEGIYDSSVQNINICAWRSQDMTATWGVQNTVLGNTDQDAWIDPDGTYGTTQNRVLIGCYNDTDNTLYQVASDDFGVIYNPEVAIYTLGTEPGFAVNPEFAAAVNHDHVMLCCTIVSGGQDEIGQCYSKDAGNTWSPMYLLEGSWVTPRIIPELIAGVNGKTWHVVYTSGAKLFYNFRPQDLSAYWQSSHISVYEGYASHAYPRKGLVCHPESDHPGVCWTDFRDGTPDLDTYYAFGGSLVGDNYQISEAAGGVSNFKLSAGDTNASRDYIILGSVTGFDPGTPLPGGMAVLPVNWDIFTGLVIDLANTPVFSKFIGKLDTYGRADAQLSIGPVPGAAGLVMHFAYALNNPWDFASNPIAVKIMP